MVRQRAMATAASRRRMAAIFTLLFAPVFAAAERGFIDAGPARMRAMDGAPDEASMHRKAQAQGEAEAQGSTAPPHLQDLEALRASLAAAEERAAKLEAELASMRDELAARTDVARQRGADSKRSRDLAELQAEAFRRVIDRLARLVDDDASPTPASMLDYAGGAFSNMRTRGKAPESVAAALHLFGAACMTIQDYVHAEKRLRRALELRQEHLDPSDIALAESKSALARALANQGKFAEAITLQQEAVAQQEASGAADKVLIQELGDLVDYCLCADRLDDADDAFRRRAEVIRKPRRLSHSTGPELLRYGAFLHEQGRLEEAEAVIREVFTYHRERGGDDVRTTFNAMCRLAWVLRDQGRMEEAEPLHERVMNNARFQEQIEDPYLSTEYGEYLVHLGRFEEAEAYLVRAYEEAVKDRIRGIQIQAHLRRLIRLYENWGRPDAAEPYREAMIVTTEPEQ